MQSPSTKHVLILSFVLAALGTAGYVLLSMPAKQVPIEQPSIEVEEPVGPAKEHKIIGTSVEGRAIEAFMYGSGEHHLLFVVAYMVDTNGTVYCSHTN